MPKLKQVDLNKFPKGINRYSATHHLDPDELADCYGFEVADDGSIITEIRWLPIPDTGLRTIFGGSSGTPQFFAMGAMPFQEHKYVASPAADPGFYYLAGNNVSSDARVVKTYRDSGSGGVDWNNDCDWGTPTEAMGGEVQFKRFAGRMFLGISGGHADVQGLYPDPPTATAAPPTLTTDFGSRLTDTASVTIVPRAMEVHLDRLFYMRVDADAEWNRVHWSKVGQAHTGGVSGDHNSLDFFPVDGYSGNGVHWMVSAGDHLYILKGSSIWTLYGRTIDSWSLHNITHNIGCVSGKTVQRMADGSVLFQGIDNDIYRLKAGNLTKVSKQLARRRYVGRSFWVSAGFRFGNLYYLTPIPPSGGTNSTTPTWGLDNVTGNQREGTSGYVFNNVTNSWWRTMTFDRGGNWGAASTTVEVCGAYDVNWDRCMAFTDASDSGSALTTYGLYADTAMEPSQRILKTSDGLTALAVTGDMAFGGPTLRKDVERIEIALEPTVSDTTATATLQYRITDDNGVGSWADLYLDDPDTDPANWSSATAIPADRFIHRLRADTSLVFTHIAFRLRYSGTTNGEGIRLLHFRLYYNEEEPPK